ncbi:MAG TPA: hypothetical protein VH637_24640 [Streptosporangiaceae bacterium]|jgi:hypothetical protein
MLVLPIAMVVMAAVAVLVTRRFSARRAASRGPGPGRGRQPVAPIDLGGDLPTFNLIALGGQETGKTVLLASIFHRLATELSDGGFRLQTSLDQSVHLTSLHATLRDCDAAWPPGTAVGDTRSFTFECVGSAGGGELPVLNFNYLDYAGELVGGGAVPQAVAEQRESRQRDLEQRIEAAHALFGLIDGQRMLGHIRGDAGSRSYLENSIVPMLSVMRKARCPVHFILTKWDLFDGLATADGPADENDRLSVVRQHLMAHPAIRNLVEQRRRDKRVVRLIPVSAIGRQFASMHPSGHMIKRKDGLLRPLNVEIPLCAVLPDLFGQIEDQLDQSHESHIMAERRARAKLTARESFAAAAKFLALPAGAAVRVAADIAIGRNAFSDKIADVFVDWVGRPFDDKMAQVGAVVDDARLQLSELRLIRAAVLREFSERMIVLKRQLPASDLSDAGRL